MLNFEQILLYFKGRASFGCAASGPFIYIFGGMLEYKKLTNSLYKLDVTKWKWSKLNPVPSKSGFFPVPRIGHSFNTVDDQIFLFGGMTNLFNESDEHSPQYLNDLFTLELNNGPSWNKLSPIFGHPPSPRESHSAVVFQFHHNNEKRNILLIYGGMNGQRLGDLWLFDVYSSTWTDTTLEGKIPRPRSLHTACIFGTRMYVFGGWTIDKETYNTGVKQKPNSWVCSRDFIAFNLQTYSWEILTNEDESHSYKYPEERAGHSLVAFDTRLYIFSGRFYDSKQKPGIQKYHKDFWCVDILRPIELPVLQLVKATHSSLEIKWNIILCTDCYLVQVSL